MDTPKPTRDDFQKLDDYSFELCVKILERWQQTRQFLTRWIGAFGEEAFSNPAVYEAIAYGYSKSKTADSKLKISILQQMKEEHCGTGTDK